MRIQNWGKSGVSRILEVVKVNIPKVVGSFYNDFRDVSDDWAHGSALVAGSSVHFRICFLFGSKISSVSVAAEGGSEFGVANVIWVSLWVSPLCTYRLGAQRPTEPQPTKPNVRGRHNHVTQNSKIFRKSHTDFFSPAFSQNSSSIS